MNVNSEYIYPLIAGTLLFAALAGFIIYFIVIYHRTRQKFEWERQQFKHALLQTEVEIREHTLKHLSRELHDNLGQVASLVKINLNMLVTESAGAQREKLNETLDLVRQLIADIKALSISLDDESIKSLKFGEFALRDIERVNKTGTVNITFSSQILLPDLKPGTEIFLYRMFQEILNNMLKHAEATKADLSLAIQDDKLVIVFADNGKGFDVAHAVQGSGLKNLRERCKLIGANLDISSQSGKGTSIAISLPITNP